MPNTYHSQITDEEIISMAESERCRLIQKVLNDHDARLIARGEEIPQEQKLGEEYGDN